MEYVRPTWDEYFMNVADAVAQRGDCRRALVGAVIVDKANRIVSTGYNGVAAGREGCREGKCPRGLKERGEGFQGGAITDCIAFHAETNAILYSDRSRHEHGTLYVNKLPCFDCLKTMEGAGIKRVVYMDPYSVMGWMNVSAWRDHWKAAGFPSSVDPVG